MSIKPEQQQPQQPLAEDTENQRVEAARERLARHVAAHHDATPRAAAMTLMAALRSTATYATIALSVLAVGSVGAQEAEHSERGVGTAARAGVLAAQEELRAANAERREERLVENTNEDRDERLVDRANEREDAREARVEERANVDEDAAARSERRATARVERWESIRDQSGLRNPDELSAAALAELRTHARREARLRAIRNRAVDAGDTDTTARADAALEREARRHDLALTRMMTVGRTAVRAGVQKMLPTTEGTE